MWVFAYVLCLYSEVFQNTFFWIQLFFADCLIQSGKKCWGPNFGFVCLAHFRAYAGNSISEVSWNACKALRSKFKKHLQLEKLYEASSQKRYSLPVPIKKNARLWNWGNTFASPAPTDFNNGWRPGSTLCRITQKPSFLFFAVAASRPNIEMGGAGGQTMWWTELQQSERFFYRDGPMNQHHK